VFRGFRRRSGHGMDQLGPMGDFRFFQLCQGGSPREVGLQPFRVHQMPCSCRSKGGLHNDAQPQRKRTCFALARGS